MHRSVASASPSSSSGGSELAVAEGDGTRVDRAWAGRAERDVKAQRLPLPLAAQRFTSSGTDSTCRGS
ncbi:MAG: hypothetical protein KF782_12890 [Labilithrix sp.]|nr:hypothetical protein [Labilithrix sp.]